MERCKSCKWYAPASRESRGDKIMLHREWYDDRSHEDYFAYPSRFGGFCTLAELGGDHEAMTQAIALDGSDYTAGLLVSPDFGCVQWQEGNNDQSHDQAVQT